MASPGTNSYVLRRLAATLINFFSIILFTVAYIYIFGEKRIYGVYHLTGISAFILYALLFLYLILPEIFFSATVGHLLVGLRVKSLDGTPLRLSQILRRRIANWVDFYLTVGIVAFVLVMATEYHQRLGDIWANTVVVDKDDQFAAIHPEFENAFT